MPIAVIIFLLGCGAHDAPPAANHAAPNHGEPLECRSDDDCWVAETPTPHPIARPARLRGRTFRGCVDGEHVPACVAGRCALRGLTC